MSTLRTRSAGLFAVLLLAALGCKAETFGETDIPIVPDELTIADGVAVAGSWITLEAPWVAELPPHFQVAIDSGPGTPGLRVADASSSFRLHLPDTLSGATHQLFLLGPDGARTPIGRIRTGGFAGGRSVPGSIFGPTQVDPSLPGVVGLTTSSLLNSYGAVVVILDARNATLREVPNSGTNTYGVGASYTPGHYLIYQPWSGGYWIKVGSTLGRRSTDSLPVYGTWWPTHEIAPGLYLQDLKQSTRIVDTSGITIDWLSDGAYGHPEHVAFSEDGVWAVPSHSRSRDGLLIFDRSARNFHWAPGWEQYTTPLFLPSGDLVAYGWRRVTPGGESQEILARVDPVTGAIGDSVVFGPAGTPFDLPVALQSLPWIVFAGQANGHLELSIRDAVTLEEIAHPRAPLMPNGCYSWSTFTVLEDVPLDRIYVVGNECYGSVPVWTFALP